MVGPKQETPSDRIRLASIGLGNWAAVLARAVGRGAIAEIVNCWSRSEESRDRFRSDFGVPRAATSLDDLLSDPEVEGVIVTTPNDVHKPVIVAALAAGKAVFTDKPIAHTMADALQIKTALNHHQTVFSVGHSARRLSGHRVMKDWIDSGRLGGVSMIEAHFTTPAGLDLTPQSWRYFVQKSPGGALIQLGVHHADTMQYLLGQVESVSAHSRRLQTASEVPDTVMVLLAFESGVLGTLATGWAAPGVYQMRVYGTEANVFYDVNQGYWGRSETIDTRSRLEVQPMGETERTGLTLPSSDMFREEIEEFALAIRGLARVEVGIDESIQALAVVIAGLDFSRRGGSPVSPAEMVTRAEATEPSFSSGDISAPKRGGT